MSIPKIKVVKCPKCGSEIEATVFESINTDYASNVADQIISGEFFEITCSKCGFETYLEYDVLYHDIKRGAMIWMLDENLPGYREKVVGLRNSANILNYKTTRIVNNINALREKVACLENNRDDRVVELCKVSATYHLLLKQPDFFFSHAFYTALEGEERIFLYDKNGQEVSCELTENAYSLFCDMYYNSEFALNFEEYYALIDYDWAENVMQQLLERESKKNNVKKTEESISASDPNIIENGIVCPKCKRALPRDSVFCHYCGTSVADSSSINDPTEVNVSNANKSIQSTPTFTPTQRKKFFVAIAIVALILAVVFIISLNNKNRPATVYNVAIRTITLSSEVITEYALISWENGEATERTLIKMMDKYGAEQGGGKLHIIERGELVEEVDDWCFSPDRKKGDYAIIENVYGYTICYISGFNKNENVFP